MTLECPHRCMHDQFCIKFPNHHFCICVMEIMWGIPFILEPNQTLACIMSSHSTSLEPKSWLTINLDPGWKCPSSPSEENITKKKFPDQRSEESKRRKFLIKRRKKTKEICRKVFEPDNIWTIQNCHHQIRKERKPRPEVVLSLWLPTKIHRKQSVCVYIYI